MLGTGNGGSPPITSQERLNLLIAGGLIAVVLLMVAAMIFVRETELRGHLAILIGTGVGALAAALQRATSHTTESGGTNVENAEKVVGG